VKSLTFHGQASFRAQAHKYISLLYFVTVVDDSASPKGSKILPQEMVLAVLIMPAVLGAQLATVRQPVRLHTINVGSRALTTEPAIVVLHGLLGSGSNFATWAKALANSCDAEGKPRRVLLADLRNHGESAHRNEMDFNDMASDVVHMLNEEGIDRAVLFGHSIGGKVAMATALLHRERVERLCVIDIAPTTYEESEEQWASVVSVVSAMRSVNLGICATKKDVDLQLARSVSDPSLRAFVLTNLLRTPTLAGGNIFSWRVNLASIESSLSVLAGWKVESADGSPYSGNTLFIAGGKSRFLRSSHLPAIQTSFERFSLSTIRSAAHWVHADEPEALLVIASNFLAAPAPSSEN
jgi:pimeloyl-ACP methyl ester carboxylesterase